MMSSAVVQGNTFPVDSNGCTLTLGVKVGSKSIANRVLLVDNRDSLLAVSGLLDKASSCAHRVVNGTFNNVPVSIVDSGDGLEGVDSVVREIRHITEGRLAIISLSTCQSIKEDLPVGTIIAVKKAFALQTNYNGFYNPPQVHPRVDIYSPTGRLIPEFSYAPSPVREATSSLYQLLADALGAFKEGLEVTCDSRYASHGYIDSEFADDNTLVVKGILETNPDTLASGTKTYHLYHLARLNCLAKEDEKVLTAAACAIVNANRITGKILPKKQLEETEYSVARKCLAALSQCKV